MFQLWMKEKKPIMTRIYPTPPVTVTLHVKVRESRSQTFIGHEPASSWVDPKIITLQAGKTIWSMKNGEVQSHIWICRFARHFEKAAKTVYTWMASNLMVGRDKIHHLSHFPGQSCYKLLMVPICTSGKQCCWWFSNPNCFPCRRPLLSGAWRGWFDGVFFVHLNFRESMT